jgi:hypothetical protein
MYTNRKFTIVLLVLLAGLLSACDSGIKFIAPEIEPPTDLIPSYVPEGFELVSGFQLSADITLPEFTVGDESSLIGRLLEGDRYFDVISPNGNDIQGVYYQGKEQLILIAKSYFPEATLDDWLTAYEAAELKPTGCECAGLLRLDDIPLPSRFVEFLEERTLNGTRVAILKGPLGWITVFVRGDYLISVESGISLEENLKIVASLTEN